MAGAGLAAGFAAAAAGFLTGGFAGAFVAGAGASAAGFFEAATAPGTGFLVPIGVRLTGGGLVAAEAGAVVDFEAGFAVLGLAACLLYTSPSPRDGLLSRMPSSA